MSFSKYFRTLALLISILVCFSSAAKLGSGKVTYKVGDADIQKKGKDNWKPVNHNQKVNQLDRIRTMMEAQVVITLPDGSAINIDENSLVEIPELAFEDGVNQFAADIKSGRVKFDIQKQTNSKSKIKFSTGTATAAIRGTSGVFGVAGGKAYASLSSGLVEFTVGDQTYSVAAGQTAIPGADGYQVIDLSASGEKEFLKELEEFIADSTISLDSLIKIANEKNQLFSDLLNSLKDSLQCTTSSLPDTITETTVTLRAVCKPGIKVIINSNEFNSTGEEIQLTTGWAASTEGEKNFPINCSIGKITTQCGQLKTYYKNIAMDSAQTDSLSTPTELKLTSSNPVVVCEKGLATVEGEFDPTDLTADLRVSVGNVISDNLVPLYTGGKFSYSVPVTDLKGNWNEKQIKVEYTSNAKGKQTLTLDLDVNKSCADVNLATPSVRVEATDSVSCFAELRVTGATDDQVILTPSMDGSPIKEIFINSDGKQKQTLTSGLHQYTFLVQDLAGNHSSTSKRLGCYPKKDKFGIRIKGGSYERLRIPPPAPRSDSCLYKTLNFSVTGIRGNDPIYINEITISQQDKTPVRLKGNDLQSNNIDYQVTIPWGQKTTVNIEVKMKNGSILKASKTYDIQYKNK